MYQVQKNSHVAVEVTATPEQVWRVIADVTRTGEWSHECRSVRWLSEPGAAVGARFRGTNRVGPLRWSRNCELIVVDPPRHLAWRTVPSFGFPDATRWDLFLEPVDGGTRITQTFEVLRAPWLADRFYAAFIRTHRDRDARLTEDLVRLGWTAGRG